MSTALSVIPPVPCAVQHRQDFHLARYSCVQMPLAAAGRLVASPSGHCEHTAVNVGVQTPSEALIPLPLGSCPEGRALKHEAPPRHIVEERQTCLE